MPDAIERVKAMLARWRDRQAYEEDQIEWFQVSADYAADIAALVARVEKLEALLRRADDACYGENTSLGGLAWDIRAALKERP